MFDEKKAYSEEVKTVFISEITAALEHCEEYFYYNHTLYEQRGYSFKDMVAPDSFELRRDYFKVDGRYKGKTAFTQIITKISFHFFFLTKN